MCTLFNPILLILFSLKNSKLAFFGAIPDPFTATGILPLSEIIAKQSPPTPVALGQTTDCTALAAMAASTAFPPF